MSVWLDPRRNLPKRDEERAVVRPASPIRRAHGERGSSMEIADDRGGGGSLPSPALRLHRSVGLRPSQVVGAGVRCATRIVHGLPFSFALVGGCYGTKHHCSSQACRSYAPRGRVGLVPSSTKLE